MMSESKAGQPYDEAVVLHVSLSDGAITREALQKDMIADYLGGRGLGVKLLYDALSPGVDPLSPDNLLIFAVGPVTATSVPTAGRSVVVTKSPLTGTVLDSNVGGYIGAFIRKAGYAAIVFKGRSEKPVYLWIDDHDVEIRDAKKVWGADVETTTDKLL
ncbi:MAG: aldehyde ferredoxin oxidoreductase N-terminal domain-containing protein, partial [Candidatus Thorarchaeota archaeon]